MYTYQRQEPQTSGGFTGYMVDETANMKSFDYTKIPRSKQFNEAMKYFDSTDDLTRNVLLAVNEADQNAVMVSLSNKLYEHIRDKVDDIDFGSIPASAGDITKIDNYEQLTDCINIMSEILQQYNQPIAPVETISVALQNMIDRTDTFTKAYKFNVELPMVMYNTIALAIVSSVGLMITSCIEFIKLPNDQGFELALDKAAAIKARDNVVFKDLEKFNHLCANGQFDKTMDYVMSMNQQKNFGGSVAMFGVAGVTVALGCVLLVIPVIRELIFFFYYARASLADYLDAQAALLTMNAYNIENNLTKDIKNKKEVARKQKAIADKFKKISNKVKVETRQAESKSTKDIAKLDKEKYKTSDIMDSIPDSANSVLF